MNLSDPELELVDPNPNVHSLFIHFDRVFFWTKLASRAVVRWSKRMYSCAGICSYKEGLCDIALSEPLLKLRPRKDLVETLLHEMIHAYLFVTDRDQDRDGHGPNFKQHMHRINKAAGLNISIYHDFHDEVELYKTHWWRCNGPCQTRKPNFGIVRRSSNTAPGPINYWWYDHRKKCGGTFVKIKEPENYGNKKKLPSAKPSGDITKYINNFTDKVSKPVLKDTNLVPVKNLATKTNKSSTIMVSKRDNVVFNPQVVKSPVVKPFSGKGKTISGKSVTNSANVLENVRNAWSNKQLSTTLHINDTTKNKSPRQNSQSASTPNTNKQKINSHHVLSPPSKIQKIDNYFKSTATSILKDLYGKEFDIRQTSDDRKSKIVVVSVNTNLVDCPVCYVKIGSEEINRHLDECLNKDAIESITGGENVETINNIRSKNNFKNNIALGDVEQNIVNVKSDITSVDFNANVSVKNEIIYRSDNPKIKIEPSVSKGIINEQKCPCCDNVVNNSVNEHLDECIAFFDNDSTMPIGGASTSFSNETIVIEDDDDDIHDETLTLNATGTKSPCPCCLKMVEIADMNDHLDSCLS